MWRVIPNRFDESETLTMHLIRTFIIALTATVAVGCASHRTASPQVATSRAHAAQQRADAAIAEAQAAMREADRAAQLTAGVDAVTPGAPRITDAERYRRTSLNLRHQAISYADLSNKSRSLAANVDDPAEQQHWLAVADDCAVRSRKLYELSDEYAKLSRRASH
jgi:hypothetical protein